MSLTPDVEGHLGNAQSGRWARPRSFDKLLLSFYRRLVCNPAWLYLRYPGYRTKKLYWRKAAACTVTGWLLLVIANFQFSIAVPLVWRLEVR